MKYQIREFVEGYNWNEYESTKSDPLEISKEVFDLFRNSRNAEGYRKRKDCWQYFDKYGLFQIRAIDGVLHSKRAY
jgi:hypothetical protein